MPVLSKTYEPQKNEKIIYEKWEQSGAFTPKIDPKKKPFVIPMPPPNVTGVLHAGHASMLAYQDILIRWHRMMGDPTLWYPGTDHAAISTQEVVERKLWQEEKKTRHNIGREKMLEMIRKFAEQSKQTILNQTRLMGASCDWTREKYTMDETESRAVREMFIRMYKDGLIYRGDRIVNWCPRCGSTLANDEVDHQDLAGHFWHIKYHFVNDPEKFIEIATTRPETMFGDTAVAVHPKDKRWQEVVGQKVLIPVINREIKIIADEYVDREFGSGGLKVTPAHDPNDFEISVRHDLPRIIAIDKEGKMAEEAGKFAGLDRFECRKQLVNELKKNGDLIATKDHEHSVGHCYRCKTIIEPLLSKQWWIDVRKKISGRNKSLQEYCQNFVREKKIKIIPERFEAQYFNWVDNFRDWCISRQIWWGHRIPAWYCDCGEVIVAQKKPERCPKCANSSIQQDPDTLDTWFSSGLWTFGPHGWPDETVDLKYFTAPNANIVMETGWDILTLWVIRMNLMTAYALDEVPYQNVYLHGMVVDKFGKKMSKSRPETCIDPVEMIEKYGCDAFRISLIVGASPGADLSLSEEKIISFRNFCNKLWNISRFVLSTIDSPTIDIKSSKPKTLPQKWIFNTLEDLKEHCTKSLQEFKFSAYGEGLYDFIWNSWADWYVEISKFEENSAEINHYILQEVLKLAHPIIPFITEKIWKEGGFSKQPLIIESWPQTKRWNKEELEQAWEIQKNWNKIQNLVKEIRSVRAEMRIEPVKKIKLIIEPSENQELFVENLEIIKRLTRCEEIKFAGKPVENSLSLISETDTAYILLEGLLDIAKEKQRLNAEIKETENFQKNLEKKLSNQKFIQNAPAEIVEKEKEKLTQTQIKMQNLQKQLKSLP